MMGKGRLGTIHCRHIQDVNEKKLTQLHRRWQFFIFFLRVLLVQDKPLDKIYSGMPGDTSTKLDGHDMAHPFHPHSSSPRFLLPSLERKNYGSSTIHHLEGKFVAKVQSSFEEHLELLNARAADLLVSQRPGDHPLLARLHLLHPLLHGILRQTGQEL